MRPIKNANGESHFCEIFLTDVVIHESNRVGPENAGWRVAQETLGAERGMTMLELAERLDKAGFRWLVESARRPHRQVADPWTTLSCETGWPPSRPNSAGYAA